MVVLLFVGFRVVVWFWLNGYSLVDNSSLFIGDLRKFCDGIEYSFVELFMKI